MQVDDDMDTHMHMEMDIDMGMDMDMDMDKDMDMQVIIRMGNGIPISTGSDKEPMQLPTMLSSYRVYKTKYLTVEN